MAVPSTIRLDINGVFCADYSAVVFSPTTLTFVIFTHEKAVGPNIGWISTAIYRLFDQFGTPVPYVPIGEFFPATKWTNNVINDWPAGVNRGTKTTVFGTIKDDLFVTGRGFALDPNPLSPQNPLLTNKKKDLVRSTTQTIRAGVDSFAPADANSGIKLRVNTLREYLDHASLQNVGGKEIHRQ